LLPNGTLDHGSVERAFEGHGRKTAAIVADVLHRTQGRAGGVMWFAATIAHAREIMASLPPNNAVMVTGDPADAKARKNALADYRSLKARHIVSVGTLTTGVDIAHTATIVLLRYSESASLLTQIMGRAWRLGEREAGINDNAPPKEDGWLLDYANNVPKHFPDGDIYKPEIRATKAGGGSAELEVVCPDCNHTNVTSVHRDADGFQIDANGYCLDTFGDRIETPLGPMPGGNIRRCHGQLRTGARGEYTRCGYYWTSKICEQCSEHNDIAARFCRSCKAEIVDPNEKLSIEFKALKRDPTQRQVDAVVSMTVTRGISAKDNDTLRADFVTSHRQFSIWLMPQSRSLQGQRDYHHFMTATDNGAIPPATVSYVKDAASGFYRVSAFDEAVDAAPEPFVRKVA
jgi:DNA repair protein RadD